MPNYSTVYGRIARHDEPVFWGMITISDGRIIKVDRGAVFTADHMFGPECIIFPGFGDVHDHLREDQTGEHNYKEDYDTGTAAALNGGVVHISVMPNTFDPVTGGQQLQWHRNRVHQGNYPVVVINYVGIDLGTEPLGGEGDNPEKCYFGQSVGTLSVISGSDLRKTLAKHRRRRVSFHVEYHPIVLMSAHGKTHSDRRPVDCINDGLLILLPLIEEFDIEAKLCHWPTGGESFELIEQYRRRGCKIDLEVSPLHLFFDTSMTDKDPSLWMRVQMNPAIQGPEHRQALIDGLRSGFIQYLATDHAPHTEHEKFSAFAKFENQFRGKTRKEIAEIIRINSPDLFEQYCVMNNHSGAPWLDTYSLICCWLMKEHGFAPHDIARVAAFNPGRFVNQFLPSQYPGRNFGKGFGDIAEGYMGSLTVLNTEATTTVDRSMLKTKVGWSPLEGHTLPGAVEAVFIGGVRY